ncbi:MAG TPA: histidine kinase dimerization/phospho-acceptor domain-containing protein [Gemmatimonadaceae bacterium]|nr:histidine kinase dimerization/phospho-acceptor domain-containing protein [Gemmatimonadaceae bacterium]
MTDGRDGAERRAAALWLRAFERLAERAAHEIRNPLNGAVLNAEVVRARAAREGTVAASLAPFAEAAASELARAAALTEAMLALARPPRAPVDLEATLRPLVTLAAAVARARGGDVELETPAAVSLGAAVDPHAARAAICLALLGALDASGRARCGVSVVPEGVRVRIARDHGGAEGAEAVGEDALTILREAGIGLESGPEGYTLLFPAR